MMMNHDDRNINGVNETQAPSEGVTPGRVSREQQPAPGRYPATARTKWTKAVNKLVMKCYIMSNPGIRGYRKRMISKWKENGGFETSEQRLADQARAIKVNGCLTEMEIEEMKREALVNTEGEDEDEALGLSGVTVESQTNADSGEQDAFVNRTENVTADVQTKQQRARDHDQLFIDKMILKESKARKKNLALGWIDYKKAYDMIPHPWILECLGLVGIAQNIKNLLANSMNGWKTELTSNGQSLGSVDIKRGIFQGDSLSPLYCS